MAAISTDSKTSLAFSCDETATFTVLAIEQEDSLTRSQALNSLLSNLKLLEADQSPAFLVNELNHIHVYLNFNSIPDHGRLEALLETWLKRSYLSDSVSILGLDSPKEIPLQSDFIWLGPNETHVVKRSEIAKEASISLFMRTLLQSTLNFDTFVERLDSLSSQLDEEHRTISFRSLSSKPHAPAKRRSSNCLYSRKKLSRHYGQRSFMPGQNSNHIQLYLNRDGEVDSWSSGRSRSSSSSVLTPTVISTSATTKHESKHYFLKPRQKCTKPKLACTHTLELASSHRERYGSSHQGRSPPLNIQNLV